MIRSPVASELVCHAKPKHDNLLFGDYAVTVPHLVFLLRF